MATNHKQALLRDAGSFDPILDYSTASAGSVAFFTSCRIHNKDSVSASISIGIDDGGQVTFLLQNYSIAANEVFDLCADGKFNVVAGQYFIVETGNNFLDVVASYMEIVP